MKTKNSGQWSVASGQLEKQFGWDNSNSPHRWLSVQGDLEAVLATGHWPLTTSRWPLATALWPLATVLLLLSCWRPAAAPIRRPPRSAISRAGKATCSRASITKLNCNSAMPSSSIRALSRPISAWQKWKWRWPSGQMPSALQEAANLDPDRMDVRLSLGQLYLAAHQYDMAMAAAKQVLEKDPQNSMALQR